MIGKKIRINYKHIAEMLKEAPDVSKETIGAVVKHGFPKEIMKKFVEYAIEGRQASVLQASLDFWNRSPESWKLHKKRVWIWTKHEITHKDCMICNSKGEIVTNEPHEIQYKKVLGYDQREIAMGSCLKCKEAGPVGLECNHCKKSFQILFTTSGDISDEFHFGWQEGKCINPYLLACLVHYDMFQDYCIHDGTENPLCAKRL